jgi:SAM-dependent methyltransferase
MASLTRIHHASPDLSGRSTESEWLDDASMDHAELERVLRDLARFNGTMLGRRVVISWLRRAIDGAPHGETLTLVDVGCGYGDLLRAIRRWSRRRNLELNLVGADLNPETIRIARAATDAADRIDFRVMNIFELDSIEPVDFIVSSLVAHHLSDSDIAEFLRLMERTARRGWAICDLQRHRFLYHFIGLTGSLARLHPMVVRDGQISVTRSLTRREWQERIAEAGILPADVTIRWFLFRFLIGRLR